MNEKKQKIETDVVIIGAGPVGLFAVFQCGIVGLNTTVIDALPEIGGQCTALYPEKPIYDIPAAPSILAGDLIENLEAQAAPFKPSYYLGQTVTSVQKEGQNWLLETDKGTCFEAKAIIIAAGAGAFGPNKPPLEGLEEFEGRSVFYMVKRKEDFRGRNILIAGGGDSAVDWAISLSEIANKTYLLHRRDKFRAAPASVAKLKELEACGKIEMLIPAQLKALHGSEGTLKSVTIENLNDGQKEIEADILLPFYGLATSLGPIAEWGLNLSHQTIEIDPVTSMTNQDMIYAVGDIAHYQNKLKLILTGFSEVAMAAHDIWRRLYPDQTMHMEYSTTKGIPGS